MQLSENFTLEEATFSETASRNNIDNTPDEATLEKMKFTASNMENVRLLLDKPIIVSSWFRCLELNRTIKSKDTSQHVLGEAVDFKCPKFGTPRKIVETILNAEISFDQLILEYNSWVHVSFKSKNRNQVLIIDTKGTRIFS